METLEQTYTNSPYVSLNYGDVRIVDATRYPPALSRADCLGPAPRPAVGRGGPERTDNAAGDGISALALPLLAVPTLTRGKILLLVSQGLTQPGSGWTVVEPLVMQLFGAVRAQQLAASWPLPLATK
jgi:hypothetical protein